MRTPLSRPAVLAAVTIALVTPFAFGPTVDRGLAALHLSGLVALLLGAATLLGSAVNIPIWQVSGPMLAQVAPWPWTGFDGLASAGRRAPSGATVAVNVGGCVVPCALVAYEAVCLARTGFGLGPLTIVVTLVTGICYVLARPVAGVGIVMPATIPAFVAATVALNLAPDTAGPVALAAGTLGPLLGADLLHLRDAGHRDAGVLVVGGAGTVESILLSIVVALFLA